MSPMLLYKFARGKYRTGWSHKFGFVPVRASGDRIWIHAVSVGEAVASGILAGALRARLPDHEIVASTTTPTGQEVARTRFGDDSSFYLPLDFSGFVRRAMLRTKPSILVLAETEIWPNLVATASDACVPVVIVNGRISDKALPRYQRYSRFFGGTMKRISMCAVQTEEYAARYASIGVPRDRIVVTGSLKYDGVATDPDPASRSWARGELRVPEGSRVLLGGSTHRTEELALARAWQGLSDRASWRLVITPRHPDRMADVESELRADGFTTARRSTLASAGSLAAETIVLIDTIGELGRFYHAADLVFIGGSLIPHGGQNPIEPAGIGKATVYGPHMFNFDETVEILRSWSGALQVADTDTLRAELERLSRDDTARETLGAAGRSAIRSRQGAASVTAELIAKVLAAWATCSHNDEPRR